MEAGKGARRLGSSRVTNAREVVWSVGPMDVLEARKGGREECKEVGKVWDGGSGASEGIRWARYRFSMAC